MVGLKLGRIQAFGLPSMRKQQRKPCCGETGITTGLVWQAADTRTISRCSVLIAALMPMPSRKPFAAWRANTTLTSTLVMPRLKRGSRRSVRPTKCSPTPRNGVVMSNSASTGTRPEAWAGEPHPAWTSTSVATAISTISSTTCWAVSVVQAAGDSQGAVSRVVARLHALR